MRTPNLLRRLATLLQLSLGLATLFDFGSVARAANPPTPAPTPASAETYRQYALQHDGDVARGQAAFADIQRLACTRCHSIDGTGQKAGPDLFSVGDQFSRRELIDAILTPSAVLAVGYETTVVETRSGTELSGILKQATDSWIELALADGTRSRINRSEIQTQRGSRVSLMPEGLETGLSLEGFTDLIEYLVSLKQPVHSLASRRGMPSEIPTLALPVRLNPLLSADLRFTNSGIHTTGLIQTGLVAVAQIPGSAATFIAADQAGIVWRVNTEKPKAEVGLFADLTHEVFSARGPNGLLGFAFHPKFRQNRKYYLKHQALEGSAIVTYVVERTVTPDAMHDSHQPSRRLLRIPAVAEHHNGGCLQFGPDGFLYIGMGDSAPNHDPQGHSQNLSLLLGKMLRIDVDHHEADLPYAIPANNPFLSHAGARPEIWAWGFREPWRFSFDSLTGDLWVADLGQERGDEVAVVSSGENHGWNVYQGFELFSAQYRKPNLTYAQPIFATHRSHGTALVGGFVYRGDPKSSCYGVYIFGDYGSKRIWGMTRDHGELSRIRQLATCPQAITAFAQDETGNLYVAGYQGMLYKLDLTTARFDE